MKKQNVYKIRMRETFVSYAFLAPALIFFFLFVIYPMVSGIFTSFFDYSIRKFEFIGFDNYVRLFGDKIFLKSLRNTLVIVFGSVPIVVLFSLFVSLTIYEKHSKIRSFFRAVFYLPVVTGTVAVTVVWKWIYDPMNGILNYLLQSANVIDKPIMWLGDKHWAIWAIILILLTTSIGQPIILYVSALGNIPQSYVEAAEVDGANRWQILKNIKWPCLMPTTLYIVVITTINSFQCFSLIQLLTSGGPNYSTSTIMYLVYEKAFKLTQFGYANSMGVILAVIIGLISLLQFKFLGKEVDY